jgi:hypothetical protein
LDTVEELPDLGVETYRLLYFIISIISLIGLIITKRRITI